MSTITDGSSDAIKRVAGIDDTDAAKNPQPADDRSIVSDSSLIECRHFSMAVSEV